MSIFVILKNYQKFSFIVEVKQKQIKLITKPSSEKVEDQFLISQLKLSQN